MVRITSGSVRNSGFVIQSLLCFDARRDGVDYARCHLELVVAVLDSVPPCDPVKIGIGSPHLTFFVLVDEKAHRPVESGIGVCSNELRAERRIPEDQQYRWSELDARVRCQPGLVDLIEELDAFVGNVLFQALDGLSDRKGAFHCDDARWSNLRGGLAVRR